MSQLRWRDLWHFAGEICDILSERFEVFCRRDLRYFAGEICGILSERFRFAYILAVIIHKEIAYISEGGSYEPPSYCQRILNAYKDFSSRCTCLHKRENFLVNE